MRSVAILYVVSNLAACGQIFIDTLEDTNAPLDGSAPDTADDVGSPLDAGPDVTDSSAPRTDAPATDAPVTDAPTDVFDAGMDVFDASIVDVGTDSGTLWRSDENACLDAESGPLVEVSQVDTPQVAYGLWYKAPFLLSAETTGGFASYRFDGARFQEIDRIPSIGFAEGIWDAGDAFIVGAPGRGVFRITIDDSGRLNLESETNEPVREARQAWGTDRTLFVPSGAMGLIALVFDGTSYSEVATLPTRGFSQGVFAADTRVWLADGSSLRSLSFDGSSFRELGSFDARSTRVWVTDTSVYGTDDNRVLAFDRDDVNLGLRAAGGSSGGVIRDIWSDGVHIFAVAGAGGVFIFRDAGTDLVLVGRASTTGDGSESLGVVGDGEFIFVADGNAGLRAFSGFACRRRR
ncbi:MAG: hypothetical protein AB8H86_01150 [Polyangiales bacterium]